MRLRDSMILLFYLGSVLPCINCASAPADLIVYNKFPIFYRHPHAYLKNDHAELWLYGSDRPTGPDQSSLVRSLDTGLGTELPSGVVDRMRDPMSSKEYAKEVYQFPTSTYNITGSYHLKLPALGTTVQLLKMPIESDLHPERLTYRANLQESITIKLKVNPQSNLQESDLPVIWRRNGKIIQGWTARYLPIHSASQEDDGLYEFYFKESDREEGRIGLTRLIIRRCTEAFWGSACEERCPQCFNGGACDDNSGLCICPPGFKGLNCESPCDETEFGETCESRCKISYNYAGGFSCEAMYLCRQNPLGCACHGHQGNFCIDPCANNTFGPDCSQRCHCLNDGPCDPHSGMCLSGQCTHSFTGPNCQQRTVPVATSFYNVRTNPNESGKFICVIQPAASHINPSAVQLKLPDGSDIHHNQTFFSPGGARTFIFHVEETVASGNYHCLHEKRVLKSTTARFYDLPFLPDPMTVEFAGKKNVTLSWRPWRRFVHAGDGPLVSYQVWSIFRDQHTMVRSVPPTEEPRVLISGLKSYEKYSFYLKLQRPGPGGLGRTGPVIQTETQCDLEELLEYIPEGLEVFSVGASEVRVRWNRAPCTERHTFVRSFHYQLATLPSFQTPAIVDTSSEAKMADFSKTGLRPFTDYFFRVRVVLSDGTSGNYSRTLAFTTKQAPPSAPRDLEVACSDESKLLMTWRPPAEPRGVVTSYELRYLPRPEDPNQLHDVINQLQSGRLVSSGLREQITTILSRDVVTMRPNQDIHGLEPNTTYIVQGRAVNAAGEGEWTDALLASTVLMPCEVAMADSQLDGFYAPNASLAIIAAVFVGLIVTVTLIVVLLVAYFGMCGKKSTNRVIETKYHQITPRGPPEYSTNPRDIQCISNSNTLQAELNQEGTMRLSRHNYETDSLYNEGTTSGTYTAASISSRNNPLLHQQYIQQHHYNSTRRLQHSDDEQHERNSNRSFTPTSQLSTFNQANTMYAASSATLGKRPRGPPGALRDNYLPLTIKTPGLDPSCGEEDQRTTSQHDDSNSSSVNSECGKSPVPSSDVTSPAVVLRGSGLA